MPSLSQSIINNIGESYIETYLKGEGLIRTEEQRGEDLKYWIDSLLEEKRIIVEKFEKFLFNELFWGKRKTIRIYKLDKIKDYKYPGDWEETLEKEYNIDSINFYNILNTIPNKSEPRKISAIYSEENIKGELKKIQILFTIYIQINGNSGYKDSITYIPVEINFEKEIMIIKAWNRQGIARDEDKVDALISSVKKNLEIQFLVKTRRYGIEHKKVLFCMSKELIYEAYSQIPIYNKIKDINASIINFINEILTKLPLRYVITDVEGNKKPNDNVMKFEAEIRNVIESLAISDYFFDRNFDEIWRMGLEAIVARIKFNDQEKVLTSLSGENTETPIFCTKTFMSLKNRIEETEKIEYLWITMERQKGNLNLKFDASNGEYLDILIKYGIRFNEKDMNLALGIYEKYETKYNEKIRGESKIAIGQ